MPRKIFLALLLVCTGATLWTFADDIPNFKTVDGIGCAGQPTPEGFQKIRELGYKTILNLRAEGEKGVAEERALVETLGLRYEWIPITPDSITEEKIQKYVAIVESPRTGKLFVHCASSHRVGALYAIYLGTRKKLPVEEALRKGAEAGLKNPTLVEVARQYIESHK